MRVSYNVYAPIVSFCRVWKDFRKTAKFGLGLALDIIPISTCSSEDAPDPYITPSNATSEANGDDDAAGPPLIPSNAICGHKMAGIVMDLVDMNLL